MTSREALEAIYCLASNEVSSNNTSVSPLELEQMKQLILDDLKKLEQGQERIEMNIFDTEEIVENCTVQIWSNSVTGNVSVGWWKNEK